MDRAAESLSSRVRGSAVESFDERGQAWRCPVGLDRVLSTSWDKVSILSFGELSMTSLTLPTEVVLPSKRFFVQAAA